MDGQASIYLDRIFLANGERSLKDCLPCRITTPAERWTYGFQVPLGIIRPMPVAISLRLGPVQGAVRIGILNEAGNDYIEATTVAETDAADVILRFAGSSATSMLVAQNLSPRGASSLELRSIEALEERPYHCEHGDLLDRYMRDGFNKTEGWCHYLNIAFLRGMDKVLFAYGVDGGVGEIGVHHGKHLIALHNLIRTGMKSVAIDVFEDRRFNLDHSGFGNREKFLANLKAWAANPSDCYVVARDSLAMTESDCVDIEDRVGLLKFFSIDGCHEVEHTVADLRTATRLLAQGGILILDDYLNQDFPGVHQAIAYTYINSRPSVTPFVIGQNKLYLTHRSHHMRYLEDARKVMQAIPETCEIREVNLYGYRSWSWRTSEAGWNFPVE